MEKPICEVHPGSRVRKRGFYGKDREYQRWQCAPDDGSKPHGISQQLTPKIVLTKKGKEKEIIYASWHKFSLEARVEGLRRLAEGQSYAKAFASAAKLEARGRTKKFTSRDTRPAREWANDYAPLLTSHYLPTEWPDTIVVDHLPMHASEKDEKTGAIKKSGKVLFHVFMAVGYVDGVAVPWHIQAFKTLSPQNWKEFFLGLKGQPEVVVCDRQASMCNVIKEIWEDTELYPCTYHLWLNLQSKVIEADMHYNSNVIGKHSSESLFANPKQWDTFQKALNEYRTTGGPKLQKRKQKETAKIHNWILKNQLYIEKALESHSPKSVGAVEKHLRSVKDASFMRRTNFKDMESLNLLLSLMLLNFRGEDDAEEWEALIEAHYQENLNGGQYD